MIPGARLSVGHQHSQFWLILAHFVDYYSLFWGPRVISAINEPQGAFTCQTSTLAVFDESGPFHGLLLTVLWSNRFPQLLNPKVHLRVGHQHSLFWPILARFVD